MRRAAETKPVAWATAGPAGTAARRAGGQLYGNGGDGGNGRGPAGPNIAGGNGSDGGAPATAGPAGAPG